MHREVGCWRLQTQRPERLVSIQNHNDLGFIATAGNIDYIGPQLRKILETFEVKMTVRHRVDH